MPEKEFELYLSLLGKLLRLSPEQKSSIEAELRDHFEERFESLVRSGMPREAAIQKALDEFGDVAGLAHEFTHLSRKHIRRRIMQGTAATVGVAAVVVIWATLFRGPEPAVGPAPNLVAQDEPATQTANSSIADQPTAPPTDPREAERAAILAKLLAHESEVEWVDPAQFAPTKLAKPIRVEFNDVPLRDVISYVAEATGEPLLLDVPTLNQEGVTGDEQVSILAADIPAYAALNRVLRDVNQVPLTWMQDAEVIRITTRDRADETFVTKYYKIDDLLKSGYTPNALIRVIQFTTDGPWENVTGVGGTIAVTAQ